MASLYPLFLNLEHKTVLVAGGGNLATQKLRTLAMAGAHLVVVAPQVSVECRKALGDGTHRVEERAFAESDLDDVDLVFAATDLAATNHRIVELARSRGILANAVDDPEFCDFYTPAVVRRGMVSLAISTAGRFPGVTRALREVLDEWLPTQDDALMEALTQLREEFRAANASSGARAEGLRTLLAQFRDRYLKPQTDGRSAPSDSHHPVTTRRDGTHDDIYIS